MREVPEQPRNVTYGVGAEPGPTVPAGCSGVMLFQPGDDIRAILPMATGHEFKVDQLPPRLGGNWWIWHPKSDLRVLRVTVKFRAGGSKTVESICQRTTDLLIIVNEGLESFDVWNHVDNNHRVITQVWPIGSPLPSKKNVLMIHMVQDSE